MHVVWGDSRNPDIRDKMAAWCSEMIWGNDGVNNDFGECVTMAVLTDSDLIAVVVFHNWNEETGVIEITGASTTARWLTKGIIRAIYGYVFDLAECQMVVQRQSENNKRIIKILRRFGFDEIRIPRLRGRNEDELMFTMTEEHWRKKEEELLNGVL